jgi:D-alanine-D-alanine ligase
MPGRAQIDRSSRSSDPVPSRETRAGRHHAPRHGDPSPGGDLRVAVVMGGANTERYVSLSSGLAVAHALRSLGYAVAELDAATPLPPSGVAPDSLFTDDEPTVVSTRPVAPTAAAPPTEDELARLRAGQDGDVLAPGVLDVCRAADVAFLTVFGDEGESGATQAYLDTHGVTYTGPSAEACALSFNKARTKEALAASGVRSPAGHVVRAEHITADLSGLTFDGPWIVKPVSGGSTIGLSFVQEPGELAAACERATVNGSDALVEEYVPGRDFTIGVLDERVFPVVETVTHRELYDYAAKYQPGQSSKRVPADITEAEREEVQALTLAAHRGLGLGPTSSRADFRLDPQGRWWFFEVNPRPGMTPTSSYPISAAAADVDFPQLCHHLVQLAARHVPGPMLPPA